MYKHFEEREASFFETIVMPQLRQRNPDARRAATTSLTDLAKAPRQLKQALPLTNLPPHLSPPPAPPPPTRVVHPGGQPSPSPFVSVLRTPAPSTAVPELRAEAAVLADLDT